MKQKLIALVALMVVSPLAQAAQLMPWKSYLAAVMLIALVIAIKLSTSNPKASSRAAKILLAGLYFWVITFAELIVLATIYHFM